MQNMDNNMQAHENININTFMGRVYRYMAFGLILTGLVTYILVGPLYNLWIRFMVQHSFIWMAILIVPFFITFAISNNALKNPGRSLAWFACISIIFGFDLAGTIIFINPKYILIALVTTIFAFIGLSFYGMNTKRNLSRWGRFAIGMLWGCIIATIINIFLKSSMFSFFLSYIIVAVFLILIAVDTQSLIQLYNRAINSDMPINDADTFIRGLSIIGALNLYLDFLNLFIYILEIITNYQQNN